MAFYFSNLILQTASIKNSLKNTPHISAGSVVKISILAYPFT